MIKKGIVENEKFLSGIASLIVDILQIILCVAILIWFALTVGGNVYGLVTGKGTMQGQIKEQQQQIEELQEQLEEAQSSNSGISKNQISDLYNKLYLEYISIKSYNDIVSLQGEYSDLQSDEYKQAVMDVYDEYEKEIQELLKDVFGLSDEEITTAIETE